MFGRWIRSFVSANRKICRALTQRFPRIFGVSQTYHQWLREQIASHLQSFPGAQVLEVGGIDRPLLKKGTAYSYHGMDIDVKERCYEIYDAFFVQSIEKPIHAQYQLILSMTLLEHVPNNTAAFENIYHGLTPGGVTLHYIPSKNHPYSLCLRMVGPKWQKILIRYLRPDSVEETGYPAFFDHCSPRAMRALCERTGFVDVQIQVFYRANDYFAFFVPAFVVVSLFENFCRYFRLDSCSSGFILSAKRAR